MTQKTLAKGNTSSDSLHCDINQILYPYFSGVQVAKKNQLPA